MLGVLHNTIYAHRHEYLHNPMLDNAQDFDKIACCLRVYSSISVIGVVPGGGLLYITKMICTERNHIAQDINRQKRVI